MMRLIPTLAAIFAFAGFVSTADAQFFRTPDAQTFAHKVAAAGQFEIQSSQLALQKSQNDAVKQFAQRMIDDHTKLGEKLRTTLQNANMAVPDDKLNRVLQWKLKQLKGVDGAKFDRLFINDQIRAHKGAVRLLERYARRGGNSALKQFALDALPIIQRHLQMARDLRTSGAPALTRYNR